MRRPECFSAIRLAASLALALSLAGCGRETNVSARPSAAPELIVTPPRNEPGVVLPILAPSAPSFPLSLAGRAVILDPGHGGKDLGASHFGLHEKDIVLDLACRAATLLRERGATVLLTREKDATLSLAERSAFANRHPEAILVSIHVNASDRNPQAFGIETYILSSGRDEAERGKLAAARYRLPDQDEIRSRAAVAALAAEVRKRGPELAQAIQRRLSSRLDQPDRGVRTKDLAVLRDTYFCPAVLVEMGFLSHPPTAAAMRTDAWRRRAAEALCEGIGDFLGRPAGG
ncbi:MAG: N-acetylmuramoyl-L-alanine amidase [Planctomycetota bacterium]|jgi:N-acetylmuramoyl-L-alanine amidase|nr:N-acetylmuramoyl-L-alanine amidase [Planctomycetota bacterium]